jgi:Xaa-Pro aminopeptidase
MPDLLLFGAPERSPSVRHEVPVPISDPFLFAEISGRQLVVTSVLERDRIAAALPGAVLLDLIELGLRELVMDGYSRDEAELEIAARVIRDEGIKRAVVPADFPVALADRLRADGVTLTVDADVVALRRRVKTPRELAGIYRAQRAAEAGMAAAATLLAQSEGGSNGSLYLDGEELYAENVRARVRSACAKGGAFCPPGIVVASVRNGVNHEPGSGPLPAGLPIQIDLWPRDEASGCWADMTRTFVVGDPMPAHAALIAEHECLVGAAMQEACAAVRAGITGLELYNAACDRFEAAGFRTMRTSIGGTSDGFRFALGHGIGLEVHEPPSLGLAGRNPLIAGDVIAIEPGLWDRRIGGVRHEDLLLVTENGCETLTRYPYELTPAT